MSNSIGTNPNNISPENFGHVITFFLDYEGRDSVTIRKATSSERERFSEEEIMADETYIIEAFPKTKEED